MTLYQICSEIAAIEDDLTYGRIQFSYDKMMSAIKPGHPADMLDEILSMIGWDVSLGNPVELDRVKEWAKLLKEFKTAFKIKDLATPIKHVAEYIKEQEQK